MTTLCTLPPQTWDEGNIYAQFMGLSVMSDPELQLTWFGWLHLIGTSRSQLNVDRDDGRAGSVQLRISSGVFRRHWDYASVISITTIIITSCCSTNTTWSLSSAAAPASAYVWWRRWGTSASGPVVRLSHVTGLLHVLVLRVCVWCDRFLPCRCFLSAYYSSLLHFHCSMSDSLTI